MADARSQAAGTAGASDAHQFAFILHPLTVDYLANHPRYAWTRHLPRRWVEAAAAHMPARLAGTVQGGRSPATGRRIDGLIYALGATPRQMLTRPPEFTYSRLDAAVRDAAERGAKIVGLGAFTKVVGDAGVTVAKRAPIAVTTGNSLTISATLETAKLTAIRLGWPSLAHGKAMIVGATGAIGSVLSRMLAAAIKDVVLVSIEPPRLEALKRTILEETPDCKVETDVSSVPWVGAVRPDRHRNVRLRPARARREPVQARRRDPRRGAAARHLGRGGRGAPRRAGGRERRGADPGPGGFQLRHRPAAARRLRVPRRGRAARDGGALRVLHARPRRGAGAGQGDLQAVPPPRFQIAPLRTFGQLLTDEMVADKRERAERLLRNPAVFERVRAEAAARIAKIPPRAKGVAGLTTLKA